MSLLARGDATPVRRAEAGDAEALALFFAAAGSRCYCQYWQYPGDHRSWQVVCAQTPEDNARRLEQDLTHERFTGLVHVQDSRIVGWLRLEREMGLEKLYRGRLYKGLPCFAGDRAGVVAVACLLVLPEHRRRGVARELVRAAVDFCRQRGDRCLEAFPRAQADVSDEEQWMGPLSIYEELGFHPVSDFAPYPVLRHPLGG